MRQKHDIEKENFGAIFKNTTTLLANRRQFLTNARLKVLSSYQNYNCISKYVKTKYNSWTQISTERLLLSFSLLEVYFRFSFSFIGGSEIKQCHNDAAPAKFRLWYFVNVLTRIKHLLKKTILFVYIRHLLQT